MPLLKSGIINMVKAHLSQTAATACIDGDKINIALKSESWDVENELGSDIFPQESPLEEWLLEQFKYMSEYGDGNAASNRTIEVMERVIAKEKAEIAKWAAIDRKGIKDQAIRAMAKMLEEV